MKTNRWLVFSLSLIMVLTLAVGAYAAPPNMSDRVEDGCEASDLLADTWIAELKAGQDIYVGDVYIDDLGDNQFLVTYLIEEDDWFLTELHFEAISDGDEEFIYSAGGLIPGKFTCKEEWDIEDEVTEYTFLYTAGDEVTGFAAHAVVCQPAVYETEDHTLTILSGARTLVEDPLNEENWIDAIDAWLHPAWVDTENEDIATVTALMADGADWIWESYRVLHPILGDIVEFKDEFTVEGEPTSATLTITADNAYAFKVNDGLEFELNNLGDGWRTSNLTHPFVSDTIVGTWKTVENHDVLADISEGSNTLYVTGVNEYQGELDNETNGTIYSNPGGVIYKLVIESESTEVVTVEVCETAWGFGEDADGSNWSQVIPYPFPVVD